MAIPGCASPLVEERLNMSRSTPVSSRRLGRISKCVITFLMATAAGEEARAEPVTYRAAPGPDGAPSLRIDLPYTFGTHQFEVREINGEVHVDWRATPVVSGRLAVPLTALRGGGERPWFTSLRSWQTESVELGCWGFGRCLAAQLSIAPDAAQRCSSG